MVHLLRRVFKTRNERILKQFSKQVSDINQLEDDLKTLSDEALSAKSAELRKRHQEEGISLQQLLPEAFALVRESARRVLGLRHFDVQLLGGMVLFEGKIAEMRTGEGKTLTATLPAYLQALSGKGVHIVTVNDYLAERDANWMRPVYEFLGLTVSVNLSGLSPEDKREVYQADIVFGTNNEFGFDYLRDNMAFELAHRTQRELSYAIIDEVDSILIDEARTPLIISGPADENSTLYPKMYELVKHLKEEKSDAEPGDFTIDEKSQQVFLSETGHQHAETLLEKAGLLKQGKGLYDLANMGLVHYLTAALRARCLFHRDVDYIVKDDKIVIVDEHTGRLMPGRRWSEGLHQSIEAKEGVPVENENQTLASITFQNYFRLYDKLSGMTGTADTEAFEFQQIYGLEVVVLPTNKPMIRIDHPDQVYLTQEEKFEAIRQDIEVSHKKGQPILVGTASIEVSEQVSAMLSKHQIPHQVLNAKFHEKEAKIIAQAGRPGAVTIATNMAGRGTDIVLGGNLSIEFEACETDTERDVCQAQWLERHDEVIAAGGLYVLGTERNESRRIDNQLRGRSGRQGDPGESRYYLSLQDNLMRIFASDAVSGMMERLGMRDGQALESKFVSRAIENAQRKVEGHNFDIRKQLLEFDDVANDQRKVIYEQRFELLSSENLTDMIDELQDDVMSELVAQAMPDEGFQEAWDLGSVEKQLQADFGLELPVSAWQQEPEFGPEMVKTRITAALKKVYQVKREKVGSEVFHQVEKAVLLQVLDYHWREHLLGMDHLRQGIHLRSYAQKQPMQEFKRECFELFSEMLASLKREAIRMLATLDVTPPEEMQASVAQFDPHLPIPDMPSVLAGDAVVRVSRNQPCPCGSGKKYKHCHGKIN